MSEQTTTQTTTQTAPKKEEITDREARKIVLTALVAAGADLLEGWTDKRIPKAKVKEILAHRLDYCGNVDWDKRLGARPESRSSKS